MLNYDLIYLARAKHEELIADAEKWSGRAYGFYPEVPEPGTENRIVAAIKSLFARQPAKNVIAASSVGALRTATK